MHTCIKQKDSIARSNSGFTSQDVKKLNHVYITEIYIRILIIKC